MLDMGKIEEEAKIIHKKGQVQKILLNTILAAGVISAALIIPNAFSSLTISRNNKSKLQFYAKSALSRMLDKGLIVFVKTANGKHISVTDKGKKLLRTLERNLLVPNLPKKWDKKWRMVMFDVPEKKRLMRNQLRKTMIHFGFFRLQDSVWIYPYDCEELISILKFDLEIGRDVLYVVAEAIEGDESAREYFGL